MIEDQQKRQASGDEQGGYLLVWLSIMLFALLGVAALAVDVGSWYSRAAQLQRSADAAALAGVVWMPSNWDEAKSTAEQTALRNGFVQDVNEIDVVVDPVASDPNRLKVTVRDKKMESIFGVIFFPHIQITRSAVAEYVPGVALGSPKNIIGGGDGGFWAAASGYYSAKEDGDYLLSRYDHCWPDPSAAPLCHIPSERSDNADYRAEGYSYTVSVPTGPSVDLIVIDGGYHPGSPGSPDKADAPGANITTYFTITDDADTGTITDDNYIGPSTGIPLGNGAGNGPGGEYRLARLSPNDTYRVKVRTQALEAQSWGFNAYGLRADGTGPPRSVCNSITQPTCPRVAAENALSLFAQLSGPDPDPSDPEQYFSFYLADLDPDLHSGKQVSVKLWDPGEGANGVSIKGPVDDSQRISWRGIPSVDIPWWTGDDHKYLPGGWEKYSAHGVEVYGCDDNYPQPGQYPGPQFSNVSLRGDCKYNDRILQMVFNYTTDPVRLSQYAAEGHGWFTIEYKVGGCADWADITPGTLSPGDSWGSPPNPDDPNDEYDDHLNGCMWEKSTLSDRTTWMVDVLGDPVRLVEE